MARTAAGTLDAAMLKLMMKADRFPDAAELERVKLELVGLHGALRDRGHIANPGGFHNRPAVPATVYARRGFHPALKLEWMSYQSEFAPDVPDALTERYRGFKATRTVHAAVARHPDDRPRPWMICLHGLGTGSPWMDLPAFRATLLHHYLGVNLIFPILPMHGKRRDPGMGRAQFVSFDLVDTMLGLSQAVWDVRTLMRWLRANKAERIGLFGLSIGAYVSGTVATLEEADLLLAGIPVADIPDLFQHHSPSDVSARARERAWPEELLPEIFGVVSPLAGPPRVPRGRRFLFAGLADRVTPPHQARQLQNAWEQPETLWFDGGHVSFVWTRPVDHFIERAVRESGFTSSPSEVTP